MTRTRSHSLDAGGLNWASLPLKLFAGGNAKFWNPADIDFSRDRADWESLTDLERDWAARLCAEFIAGEEAVTQDIQPFMAAMRAEGRLGDEMYLTQFAFEEAKHTQVFRMWLDAVGMTDDLQHYLDGLPAYRKIFYEELPESLDALSTDPSPAAQIRASATYNHVIEGMMALTGYYAWHRICVDRGILPGMQELVKRIGDDERRHMAWGTFTCRRHVAADERNWAVFEKRMNELIPLALQNTGGADASGMAITDTVPSGATGSVSGIPTTLAPGAASSGTQATFLVPVNQRVGSLTDTASLTWQDAKANVYGPVSSLFTTQVQAANKLSITGDAGPNPTGATEAVKATLVDLNGQPIANQNVFLNVTGANTQQSTVATDPVTGHTLKVDVTLNVIK